MESLVARKVSVWVLATMFGIGCAGSDEGSPATVYDGTGFVPTAPPAVVGGTGGTAPVGGTGGVGSVPPPTVTGGTGGVGVVAGAGGLAGVAGDTALAGAGGMGEMPLSGGFPPESACLDGITDFFSPGPFTFSHERSGSVHLYVPDVPPGCSVPVIHLANGTGGTCGTYASIHERFASHGFLATCYESTQTGNGSQGLEAFQTAHQMYPDLAAKRFGSTGHSQGGQAAFTVLQLTEAEWGDEGTYAGLAMEPASGFGAQPSGGTWQQVYAMIRSPMFMFSGTSDTLVSRSWVSSGFAALDDSIEAYHWSAVGATHIPTPNADTMQVGVPWFRWKLLNDQAACMAFKGLEGAGDWNSVEEQNAQPCM